MQWGHDGQLNVYLFAYHDILFKAPLSLLKRMAGTTRLELATSAVTVHGNALTRKGLLHNPFSYLAQSGTVRHAQALTGKKNWHKN